MNLQAKGKRQVKYMQILFRRVSGALRGYSFALVTAHRAHAGNARSFSGYLPPSHSRGRVLGHSVRFAHCAAERAHRLCTGAFLQPSRLTATEWPVDNGRTMEDEGVGPSGRRSSAFPAVGRVRCLSAQPPGSHRAIPIPRWAPAYELEDVYASFQVAR